MIVSGELAFPEKTLIRDGRKLSRRSHVVRLHAFYKETSQTVVEQRLSSLGSRSDMTGVGNDGAGGHLAHVEPALAELKVGLAVIERQHVEGWIMVLFLFRPGMGPG
jgi:hypothetical protein